MANPNVLIVDDDPQILQMLGSFVKIHNAGASVTTARNKQEALDALTRSAQQGPAFDFMITDYELPGGNGVEVIQEAQKLMPGMRMVIGTGNSDALQQNTDYQQLLQSGVLSGCIEKGVMQTVWEYKQAIARHVPAGQQHGQSSSPPFP